MRTLILAACLALASLITGHAYAACPVPNPNLLAPPFFDGCTLPASSLNNLGIGDKLSPRAYGAVGNGVANDTAAVQAAINAAQALGSRSVYVGDGKYNIQSALADNGVQINIVGNNGGAGAYGTTCTNGLIIGAANFNLLTFTNPNSTITNYCIAAAAGVTNTSGAAITVTYGASAGANSAKVTNGTIYGACIDVSVTGSGTNQTDDVYVMNNEFVPVNHSGCAAIQVGSGSTDANTVDNYFMENGIYCGGTASAADGIDVFDSGGSYFMWNTMYHCNHGTYLLVGAGQLIQANYFEGILGDTSTTYDLLVDTVTTTGAIFGNTFNHWWASSGADGDILIQNSGNNTSLSGLYFDGGQAYIAGTGNIGFHVNGSWTNVRVTNSTICAAAFANTGAGAVVFENADNGSGPKAFMVANNHIGACDHFSGSLTYGIVINNTVQTGNLQSSITGNQVANGIATVADRIVDNMTASPTESLVLENNEGVSEQQGSVADAATIAVGLTPTVTVTGTGTNITAMGPGWANRKVTLIPTNSSGIVTATGGSVSGNAAPFCAGVSQAQYNAHTYTLDNGLGCWIP